MQSNLEVAASLTVQNNLSLPMTSNLEQEAADILEERIDDQDARPPSYLIGNNRNAFT